MNKKILVILLLIMPLLAVAENRPTEDTPIPVGAKGISMVKMSQQSFPDSMKKKILNSRREFKENGFVTTRNNPAKYLLNIEKYKKMQSTFGAEKYGDLDTTIKSSPSQIRLSFPFTPIKGVEKNYVIGYAAIGSYEKNKGWNGIKEIFSDATLGNCSYSRMGIIAVQLNQETTEYFVNNKPCDKIIKGNYKNGFLYTITWYTNDNMFELECANKNFDQQIMKKMILLANIVDKA